MLQAAQNGWDAPRIASTRPAPKPIFYLQHYQGTTSYRYAASSSADQLSLNWSELQQNGNAPTSASVYPPGPEADPYLQHYRGTTSNRYGLTAGTWQLMDYAIVDRNGCATHPLGKHAVGYLLISPEHYVAMTVAVEQNESNKVTTATTFINHVGTLKDQGDRIIQPLINLTSTSLGMDQMKSWQLANDKLILTAPTKTSGTYVRSVWGIVK